MDVQSVLNLPTQRLYDELIEAVLTNPVGLKDIVKELFSSKNLPDSRFNYVNYSLNKFLYQYYIEKGDREGALVSLEKSYSYIEKEMEELYKRKVNSFKIVEKNASIEEDISNVLEKNQELKLITDEAVKNKELAETALLRLSLVNELGKQLTYSLDMEGIITTIYEKLNEKLPLECFLNNNYGHLEGDEALKSIALIINKHFEKAGGISARFGGEEFIAACLNLSENECLELAVS